MTFNYRYQQFCALSGFALVFLFFPLAFLMEFVPPPSPSLGGVETSNYFLERPWAILLGGAVCIQVSALGMLWTSAISVQIQRIEKRSAPIFSLSQTTCGVLAFSVFIFGFAAWLVGAFRPERAPEIIQAFSDWGFLIFLGTVGPLMGQSLSIGAAILSDDSKDVIYPRWAGFFNCWTCLLFLPGSLIPFFKTGPFAWTGIFGFWIPVFIFGLWMVVMSLLTLRAINQQSLTDVTGSSGSS